MLSFGLATAQFPSTQPIYWLPAVRQWEEEGGYCGETAIQQAGLFYGQYNSQGAIRAAYGSGSQKSSNQVLFGDDQNDANLLKKLKFTYQLWDWENTRTPQSKAYKDWINSNVQKGIPTIFTIYLSTLSDEDYDHIVLAVGYESSTNSTAYYEFDTTDHWKTNWPVSPASNADGIIASRSQCSKQKAAKYCMPNEYDYGAALTGIIDTNKVTLPVHIQLDQVDEPNWVYAKAKGNILKPDITITNLKAGQSYVVLGYNSYTNTPSAGFNVSQADLSYSFVPLTDTYTFQETNGFLSTGSRYYRCVQKANVFDAEYAKPVPQHAVREPRK